MWFPGNRVSERRSETRKGGQIMLTHHRGWLELNPVGTPTEKLHRTHSRTVPLMGKEPGFLDHQLLSFIVWGSFLEVETLQHTDHPTHWGAHSSVPRITLHRGSISMWENCLQVTSDGLRAYGKGMCSISYNRLPWGTSGGKRKEAHDWGQLKSTQLVGRALVMETSKHWIIR